MHLSFFQASSNTSTVPPSFPHHPPETSPGAGAHLTRTERAGWAHGSGGSNDGTQEDILCRPLLSLPGFFPKTLLVWQRWMWLPQQYGVGISNEPGTVATIRVSVGRSGSMGWGGGSTGWYSSCWNLSKPATEQQHLQRLPFKQQIHESYMPSCNKKRRLRGV